MIETEFTPFVAALGGVLIGFGAVLLMWARGNVFGATGILAGVFHPSSSSDWAWRVAVLAGMLTGPFVYLFITGAMPQIQVPVSTPAMVIGGLLVGIGVTFGAGCTSGHGVCGMARLSPRSFVATATFMAVTALTVFVMRHIVGG